MASNRADQYLNKHTGFKMTWKNFGSLHTKGNKLFSCSSLEDEFKPGLYEEIYAFYDPNQNQLHKDGP